MAAIPATLRLCCRGAALISAFFLSACAETMVAAPVAQPVAENAIRPSGFSPRPAALAVTQMEGAPEPLKNQFMAYFDADVAQREVTLTDANGARYLARGYISAYPVDGGARLSYVWDIYDRAAHRAQRLNDEIALKGAAADPWSMVDAGALAELARRSAGDLAAYLSNTPEALAAAPQPASAPTAALSYAPAR